MEYFRTTWFMEWFSDDKIRVRPQIMVDSTIGSNTKLSSFLNFNTAAMSLLVSGQVHSAHKWQIFSSNNIKITRLRAKLILSLSYLDILLHKLENRKFWGDRKKDCSRSITLFSNPHCFLSRIIQTSLFSTSDNLFEVKL